MAINEPRLHLLAYDIADPARLQRVHRSVRAAGIPLQYSVFLVPGRPRDIDNLLDELAGIIEPAEDDIRVYPLPHRLHVQRLGRQHLPEGIALLGNDRLDAGLRALVGEAEPD